MSHVQDCAQVAAVGQSPLQGAIYLHSVVVMGLCNTGCPSIGTVDRWVDSRAMQHPQQQSMVFSMGGVMTIADCKATL